MLANNVCLLRTCSFFVGQQLKRQTVRCSDWLAVVNIMMAECTDASCVDYTNYTSPFYLCIIHDCTQTDFGCLRFRLRAIKQITAAAMSSSSSAESANSPPYCRPTKCCRVWHKCLPIITTVGQHLLVMCLQLYSIRQCHQQKYLLDLLIDYAPVRTLLSSNANLLTAPPWCQDCYCFSRIPGRCPKTVE